MKKQLLLVFAFVLMLCQAQAQTKAAWSAHQAGSGKIITDKGVARQSFPKEFKLYDLNINSLRGTLFAGNGTSKKAIIISLPNAEGQMEDFEMYEASNFEADLQAQFPEIRAYSGKGITDKYATLKLSLSPQGIQTMVFRTDKENEFIEPYSQDHSVYAVFKSQREKGKLAWTCSVDDKKMVVDLAGKSGNVAKSSVGQLKTMKLAQSCTAEYSNYFGATSAAQVGLVMAAFNATMTRCNGVYEKDLGLHLNLIAGTTAVIYYDAATDPYAVAGGAGSGDYLGADGRWNGQLMTTLRAVLGDAAFDIGHLFGASGGGGNAGCIGCVCDNTITTTTIDPTIDVPVTCVDCSVYEDPISYKGSGFTSPGDGIPQGDNFDIDYVVHEVGHQLGGRHTFTHGRETGSTVQVEPGSGATIMGYAGITSYDFVPHSIDKYHAATIAQIQANLSGKTCPITTNISANNATPVAGAGVDYTIPKSTPFLLTGTGTDANTGDALTYSWEQMDALTGTGAGFTGASSGPSATKATGGANWRSFNATSSPSRNFPTLSTTLANQQATPGLEVSSEALSSVARTLNFRLTVRDNAPYSSTVPVKVGQTNFDDMVVTVSGTAGPFDVTSQATADQTWIQGSTQNITWAVGGTNVAYAANVPGDQFVDILLSTDGGLTFPTVLVANTANDGTQTITVPNVTTTNARVMVKAHTHIFYDINPQPIAIGYTVVSTCNNYTLIPTDTVIPDDDTVYKTDALTVPTTANISDVNLAVNLTHTWISDMTVAVLSPLGTQVNVFSRSCTSNNNINATFDDQGSAITCAPTITGNVVPAQPLSALNGQNPNGTWTFGVIDTGTGDTGNINSYTLTVCSKAYTLSSPEFEFADFSLFPNPNSGNFNVKFTSDSSNDIKINVHDMRGRQVYEKLFSNTGAFNQNVTLNKVEAGIYLVSIIDGAKKTVKRIVVE